MTKRKIIPIVALLLVFCMMLTTACGGASSSATESEESSSSESSSSESSSSGSSSEDSSSSGSGESSSEVPPSGEQNSEPTVTTTVADKKEAHSYNSDVVGWLEVPGTTIDEPVVYKASGNEYYLRLNWMGSYDWYGSYYADYRTTFGTRDKISYNTVIYGHSMSDDSSGARFSQLKKFKDQQFCQNNPYIYYSTMDGDYVFQIFAVFYTTTTLVYNNPEVTAKQAANLAAACQKKSLYNYNVSISEGDKLVTLSTCVYSYDGKTLGYPNEYRFVVMGKLLPASATLSSSVTVTVNSNAKK